MMKKTYTLGHLGHARGFTLIELLVVIAIIGILASVVLASLNTARDKGTNTAIKSNLANTRAEAEIFYDSNSNQYDGVCAISGTNIIGDGVTAAANAGGASYAVSDTANITATVAVCHDAAGGWAAAAPLKGGNAWCVDSAGYSSSTVLTALDTDNDITCN